MKLLKSIKKEDCNEFSEKKEYSYVEERMIEDIKSHKTINPIRKFKNNIEIKKLEKAIKEKKQKAKKQNNSLLMLFVYSC